MRLFILTRTLPRPGKGSVDQTAVVVATDDATALELLTSEFLSVAQSNAPGDSVDDWYVDPTAWTVADFGEVRPGVAASWTRSGR